MNMGQKQVGWGFWAWWTGLTILGGLAGHYISDALGFGFEQGIYSAMLGSGVYALFISAAQWIVLRRLFSGSRWWLLAGALGRAFGAMVGWITVMYVSIQIDLKDDVFWYALFFMRGTVLGISEWIVLKQWRTRAGLWILTSAVVWTLGPFLASMLVNLVNPTTTIGTFLNVILTTAGVGTITGAVMVWISRKPVPALEKNEVGRFTFLSALVWALSWGVSWAVGWSIVRYIGLGYSHVVGGDYGGLVGGIIAGLIGGIVTAIVIKRAKLSNSLKTYHIVLFALGWSVFVFYDWLDGFVVASVVGTPIQSGIGGPLSGVLGGVLTAIILWWAVRTLNWKQLLLIAGGWATGFSLAGLISWTTGFEIARIYVFGPFWGDDPGITGLILLTIVSTLCGAIAGWIGGFATFKQFETTLSQKDEVSVE